MLFIQQTVRVPLCKRAQQNRQVLFWKIRVCVWFQMKRQNHLRQRKVTQLWNCMPDREHGTEDGPSTTPRAHLQTPPPPRTPPPNCDLHHFLFFVDPNWCFLNSSLVFRVDTKSRSSLEYCSAAIYTVAKQTIWLLHTISHIILFFLFLFLFFFLVVLCEKKLTTTCKHDKKKQTNN